MAAGAFGGIADMKTGQGIAALRIGSIVGALLATTAFAAPAVAQDDDGFYWAQRKNAITVTATRLPSKLEDVPATVTVIDDQQIADELVTDIKDLVRFEPGVTVPRSPSRFGAALGSTGRAGNEGFTIRGIGGNRTLILADGVRVPDGFSFGAQSVGRGDYVDLGLVKSVEILRGPASALYGSDGLSGAVSFTLADPEDFLKGGAKIGGLVRAGYSSDDNEFAETAILAGGGDTFSVMAAYTRRDFNELKNQGDNDTSTSLRTEPNPQDGHSNVFLGRIVVKPGGGHKLRLTGEYTDTYLFTDVLSGHTATVLDLKGTDTGSRARIAGEWSWDGDGTFEHAQLGVYWQQAKDRQFTAEDRTTTDRTRDNTFDNRVYGASAEARASFGSDGFRNRLVFGGDVSFTRQQGIRGGTVPTPPDVFPTRAFPVTDFTLGGLFVGDEIAFGDGTFTLFPALRFDAYDLNATDDPLLPNFDGSDQSGSRVSPKVGAVVKLSPNVRLFANYAQGFKAPAPSQVNNYFENLAFGYTSVPNPDLKPESSTSYEGGVRFGTGGFNVSGTVFKSDYKNFISQEIVSGTGAPGDPLVYQFINIDAAEIWGLEAKAELQLKNGITGRLAAAFAKGDEVYPNGGKLALSSVDPLSLVAGLGYRDPGGRLGGELIATHNSRKALNRTTGVDIDGDPANFCGASACYRPGGFTILDATAFFKVTEGLTIRAGVFNIFDEKYTYWSDVRGLLDSSAVKDAYTRPGRNGSVSASYRF